MSISKKVTTLLGKSLGSKGDDTIHLGQVLAPHESPQTNSNSPTQETLNSPPLSETESALTIDGHKPSVLDLDFMRSSLDEIDMIQNQDQSIEKADTPAQELPLQMIDETSLEGLEIEDTEGLNTVSSHETNLVEHTISKAILPPKPQKVIAYDERDIALALGTSGYWSYSFKTGKSVLSEYITEKLSDEEISQVETQGLISIIHPDDIERVQHEFDMAVTSRTRMDCEFKLILKQETDVVIRMIGEAKISPLSNEPDVFIAFLNDITKDVQREQEFFALKELSQNKSTFLARMSHEIKTPLNAIVGMTEALRDEVDNDEARETASFIADAAENLNNILSQTLEHERLSTSDISLEEDTVNLAELIKSVTSMWKKTCKDKGLELKIKTSPDLPHGIKLDSSRFRQCLTNLLSNAVKFTETGSITVAAAAMNVDSNTPRLLVAVRDTGIGMSAEAIKNVFKPFKQGDTTILRRFGGSGLGMSITQHIINAMDGNIKIQSAEDEGSTIAITIPLRVAEAVDVKAPALVVPVRETPKPVAPKQLPRVASDYSSPHTLTAETFHKETQPVVEKQDITEDIVRKNVPIIPSDYSGFRVLVVEDNPINQAVVKKLLSKHIAAMEFAFHGEEAIQILETQNFDVILMDIHMPIKDGIETTLEIRNSGKAWADTVIVALTADPDYQQKRVCMNIGMNDALSKPVKRQDLLDVMQRVLNERRENEDSTALSA